MKNPSKSLSLLVVSLAVTIGLTNLVALAGLQNVGAKVADGTNACAGRYYAYAKMTNDAGSIWIKPPTNIVVSSGTLTDASGFPSPYSSYAAVQKSGTSTWSCGSNNVTFAATNTGSYQLVVFVTSPTPPPTNNEPMTLQIQWQ